MNQFWKMPVYIVSCVKAIMICAAAQYFKVTSLMADWLLSVKTQFASTGTAHWVSNCPKSQGCEISNYKLWHYILLLKTLNMNIDKDICDYPLLKKRLCQ